MPHKAEINPPRKSIMRWAFPLLAGFVLVTGLILTWWIGTQAEADWKDRLLEQTAGIARTMDVNLVGRLHFDDTDRQNFAYQRIRAELTAYGQALGLTQIWSDTRKDGHLVFGPENIPADSPMASAPGTIYKNPPKKNLEVFLNGQPGIEGPFTDEYGTFVSAYAPVKDLRTGKVLLVIGTNIPTEDWSRRLWQCRVSSLGLTLGMLVFLLVSHRLWQWRENNSGDVKKRFRHLEAFTVLFVGLLLTWSAARLAQQRVPRELEALGGPARAARVRRGRARGGRVETLEQRAPHVHREAPHCGGRGYKTAQQYSEMGAPVKSPSASGGGGGGGGSDDGLAPSAPDKAAAETMAAAAAAAAEDQASRAFAKKPSKAPPVRRPSTKRLPRERCEPFQSSRTQPRCGRRPAAW